MYKFSADIAVNRAHRGTGFEPKRFQLQKQREIRLSSTSYTQFYLLYILINSDIYVFEWYDVIELVHIRSLLVYMYVEIRTTMHFIQTQWDSVQ
jgi:hypothetical protein